YQSVDPAGRLDQDSSGALVLSNDGDFLFKITHPRFHVPKRYAVTLHKVLQPADLQALKRGIVLMPENKRAQMADIQPDPRNPKRYKIELITGYNRQIRRSLEVLGYRVEDLHRLAFGPATLRNLEIGGIRP